jgi:hypothetical protein
MPAGLAKRDFMGSTEIFDYLGMAHRNICRPLLKARYRVAAGGHQVAQKPVSFRHRTAGTANKAPLGSEPQLCESCAIAWRERTDIERIDTLRALFEPCFAFSPASAFRQGAGILSVTKLREQPRRPPLSKNSHPHETCNYHHHPCDNLDNMGCTYC